MIWDCGMERYRSHRREGGLIESSVRLVWWSVLRGLFRTWNRLQIIGREHLPAEPPFVLAANHASHLDALLLTAVLPLRWRDQTFPLAAHDVFFESHPKAAFAATFINAMSVHRRGVTRHGLADLRARIVSEPCVFVLFPEGADTQRCDESVQAWRWNAGRGDLRARGALLYRRGLRSDAGQSVGFAPNRLLIRLGPPQRFAELPNERSGWDLCATAPGASRRRIGLTRTIKRDRQHRMTPYGSSGLSR